MISQKPVAEHLIRADQRPLVLWAEAQRQLAEAETYWLATSRPEGRPHVMPVLAVWVNKALYFSTGANTRKGKNLARNAHCVISVGNHRLDLVVEGRAAKLRDETRLQQVAEAYASKYGWHVSIRDGAFYADGAPTAGPPPYDVYEVTPTTAFAFGKDDALNATRWRFEGG